MIVSEQFVKEVNRVIADEALIFRIDKRVPWLLRVPTKYVVVLGVQLYIIFVQIIEQIFCPEDLCDLYQLVRVAVPVEEGLLSEDHRSEHGTEGPHVKGVVVLLEIDQKLGAFEVTGRDPDVIFSPRVVELSETPINQSKLGKISHAGQTHIQELLPFAFRDLS